VTPDLDFRVTSYYRLRCCWRSVHYVADTWSVCNCYVLVMFESITCALIWDDFCQSFLGLLCCIGRYYHVFCAYILTLHYIVSYYGNVCSVVLFRPLSSLSRQWQQVCNYWQKSVRYCHLTSLFSTISYKQVKSVLSQQNCYHRCHVGIKMPCYCCV